MKRNSADRKIFHTWIFLLCLLMSIPLLLFGAQDEHSTSLVFPTKSHSPIRKATGTHLFFAVGRKTTVNNPQGTAVTKLNVLDDPDTEDDDDELTVYGVNADNNEIIYNTSLINIELYRKPPNDPGSLLRPRGITANPAGDVYVADMGHQRIARLYNKEGKELVYKSQSRPDSGNFAPFDVSLATDGSVFVSDSTGGKIWRWYPENDRWDIILSGIEKPLGIDVYDENDRWTRYNFSRLGIVIDDGASVMVTDFEGNHVGTYKPQDKKVRFRYIAVDYYGNFYTTDVENSQIVMLDRQGRPVDVIGQEGKRDYQFLYPQGISIWKRYGQVCVAESYAAQYFLIGTDVLEPSFRVGNETLHLQFRLTEGADVTIRLHSDNKGETRTILNNVRFQQGERHFMWNIPPEFDEDTYTIQLEAVPSYSSTKFFSVREEMVWEYGDTNR